MLILARIGIFALAIAAFFGTSYVVGQLTDDPEDKQPHSPLIIGIVKTPTPSPPPWPAPERGTEEAASTDAAEVIPTGGSDYGGSTKGTYTGESPLNSEPDEPPASTGPDTTQQETGGGSGGSSEVIEEGRVGG